MSNKLEIWKPIFSETINKELGMLDGVFSKVNVSGIRECCKRRFCKQMKGYVFLYLDDYNLLKNVDGSVDKIFLEDISTFRREINRRRQLINGDEK